MKCAFVRWIDSVHLNNWNHGSEMPDATKLEESCGFVVRESEDWVMLCLSIAAETKQYGHLISIPKVAIKHIEYFEKSNKPKAKRGKVQAQEVGGVRLQEARPGEPNAAQARVRDVSGDVDHV